MTFTPPGGQQRVFEMVRVDDEISALEAELIEDAGGRQWDTFMGFALQMSQGSFRAVRVLLWVFLRREDPAWSWRRSTSRCRRSSLRTPETSRNREKTSPPPPLPVRRSAPAARLPG
jgi:hypothetical protein